METVVVEDRKMAGNAQETSFEDFNAYRSLNKPIKTKETTYIIWLHSH